MRRVRFLPKFTYANVIATIALVIALGGTASAAAYITGVDIVNGSVTGRDVQRGTLTGRHISNETVTGTDVKNGSLTARDFRKGALPRGERGARGARGATGATGATGIAGPAGKDGVNGINGTNGTNGTNGADGADGLIDYALFFALMPPDNAATVATGGDVDFPQDGPVAAGSGITRIGPDSFNLAAIGTYEISFQVSVSEAGQLLLTLNGADLAYTVAGRATGTSQIVATTLVTTTVINSVITVRNPVGNATALTITPLAGGTVPTSATLTVKRLA